MTNDINVRENVGSMTDEEQKVFLEEWFRANYEDPANRLPYESAEGGYLWIWGGPYDAREELEGNFGGIASDHVIEELAAELTEENWEWAPTEDPSDYEDQLLDDILQFSDAFKTLTEAIDATQKLNAAPAPHELDDMYYRMLFAQVITSLETYLSDTFIAQVLGDEGKLRKFVETTPEFKETKVSLADVLAAAADIESTVKKHLVDVIWHNISKVKNMYKDALDVQFPEDLSEIYKAVDKRHDIVHRSGKNKNGDPIEIGKNHVDSLIEQIDTLVASIEEGLRNA